LGNSGIKELNGFLNSQPGHGRCGNAIYICDNFPAQMNFCPTDGRDWQSKKASNYQFEN
jgi:hypothetical protein